MAITGRNMRWRVRQALAEQGLQLRRTMREPHRSRLGEYYAVEISTGRPARTHLDLEALAIELGG